MEITLKIAAEVSKYSLFMDSQVAIKFLAL